MSHQPIHIYEFGPYRLDAAERLLLRDGAVVPLQPKVFDLLLVLVEQHGHLLEKEELLQRVWPDTVVEEANLANNISILRKTLGENGQPFIETAPKHGYRFVAPVSEVVEKREAMATGAQGVSINDWPELTTAPLASAHRTSWRWLAVALGVLLVVAGSLYAWRSRVPSTTTHSLAVLPFKPLVAENRDEALQLGLADTLIFKLSGLQQLLVRPTSAVRKYTDPEQDPLAAGREQQVQLVLDPSFQRDGERIKVRARLLNVADGKTLWAYECEEEYCANLFVMQDAISAKVVKELALHLTEAERARMTKHGTESREAYLLCLRGRYHVNRRSAEEAKKGIEYFQQAIQIDPDYALAYVGLGEAYQIVGLRQQPNEMMPRAKAAIDKALTLDVQLGEAYSVRASIKDTYDWDRSGAEQDHQHALELNPNVELTHRLYAISLMMRGRFEEALSQINRALEIEPLSVVVNRDKAHILYNARRYDRAIEQCRKTIDLDPNFASVFRWLGQSYEAKHDYEQAVAAYLQQTTILGRNPEEIAVQRTAYRVSGWKGYWQKWLALLQEEEQERVKKGINIDPYPFVQTYARLSEKESAFEWLEKSFRERRSFVDIKVDPLLDSLRADPRFTDLLRRLNLAP